MAETRSNEFFEADSSIVGKESNDGNSNGSLIISWKTRTKILMAIITVVLLPIVAYFARWTFTSTFRHEEDITIIKTELLSIKNVLKSDKFENMSIAIAGIKKDMERVTDQLVNENAQWEALKKTNDKVVALQIEVEVVRRMQMIRDAETRPAAPIKSPENPGFPNNGIILPSLSPDPSIDKEPDGNKHGSIEEPAIPPTAISLPPDAKIDKSYDIKSLLNKLQQCKEVDVEEYKANHISQYLRDNG